MSTHILNFKNEMYFLLSRSPIVFPHIPLLSLVETFSQYVPVMTDVIIRCNLFEQ